MAKFKVEISFDVYIDSYENGEGEHVNCWDYNTEVEATTPTKAIEKAFDELGFSFDMKHAQKENDCIYYSNLVDVDNNEANENQKESWKKNKLTLYVANSTIRVYELNQVKFN